MPRFYRPRVFLKLAAKNIDAPPLPVALVCRGDDSEQLSAIPQHTAVGLKTLGNDGNCCIVEDPLFGYSRASSTGRDGSTGKRRRYRQQAHPSAGQAVKRISSRVCLDQSVWKCRRNGKFAPSREDRTISAQHWIGSIAAQRRIAGVLRERCSGHQNGGTQSDQSNASANHGQSPEFGRPER